MSQVKSGRFVEVVAPTGGCTVGKLYIIGGIIGVAEATVDAGVPVTLDTEGEHDVTKATGFAPSQGDIAYHDVVDGALNGDTSNPFVGVYTLAAVSGATIARIKLGSGDAVGAALERVEEFQFLLTPASGVAATKAFDWIAPADGELDEVILTTAVRPSSASGTVAETVTNLGQASPLAGTTNMLTAVSVELKAGIVNDTPLTPTLSATAANRRFVAGDHIRFAIAASNADVVAGSGISHRVRWHRR